MRTSEWVECNAFPCSDVIQSGHWMPSVDIDEERMKIVLISEAAPKAASDGYYAPGSPLFAQTTIQSFQEAGAKVETIQDILDLGVYLTSAVKCSKTGYNLQRETITACSHLLESELNLFPNVQAYLLMGDVAIKAVNAIAKRAGQPRVIPSGPTYKLRGGQFSFRGKPAFPSYLQAGPSFFIEKGKHAVIAQDIAAALRLIA